ncbi:MAG: hypothetical protein ACK56I_00530, partial [bacterium]
MHQLCNRCIVGGPACRRAGTCIILACTQTYAQSYLAALAMGRGGRQRGVIDGCGELFGSFLPFDVCPASFLFIAGSDTAGSDFRAWLFDFKSLMDKGGR